MIGHSIGEYVAATISGVLNLKDALWLTAERGRVMADMPRGAMLAVSLSEEDVLPMLADFDLEVATVNSTNDCVVAGEFDAVKNFYSALEEKKMPANFCICPMPFTLK
jgi:acyl transferase domain-containing protein